MRIWPGNPFGWLLLFFAADQFTRAADSPLDFFERRIRPVLAERCYSCHSAQSEKLKGGLLLDTRAGLLKGGESGQPAIVPGDAEHSRLIKAIRHTDADLKMPPKQKLNDAQIADFITWINLGAPDPRTGSSPGAPPPAVNGPPHWAFQAVGNPSAPAVRNQRWPQSPIDHFILAKLEARGLKPSLPADKRTLIRRVTYDLTGLPPTPGEVDDFLRDNSSEAFARVVDRLLGSPRYGERWGRYWLDVARYADTKGYIYDGEETRWLHAPVYRDWVIRALNEDLPYDRFIMLQLAADQLVSDPHDENLAAMGFLTVGRRFLGIPHDIIDDRIDVATRGLLGLTVTCARCHDHKYDPIPTRDYYSLYGVFGGSYEQRVALAKNPPETPEYKKFAEELKKRQDKFNAEYQTRVDKLRDRARARTADYLVASLDISKLPTEDFQQILSPDDLNASTARHWHTYLYQRRNRFDPIFTPWHAFAQLGEGEFAAKAAQVAAECAADARKLNPHVAQLFTNAPASMQEVATRYGGLFESVFREWTNAVALAITNKTELPVVLPDADREALRQVLYTSDSPVNVPFGAFAAIEDYFEGNSRDALRKLEGELDRWLATAPGATPHAVVLRDQPVQYNPRIFYRGNPARRGDEVPKQFLEVLAGPQRRPFQQGSGRLELARAIADRDNPLTARVLVNRVWLHHFGAGLVRTPSDFGTRCEPPSHPDLLDWLARRFMDDGWSVKKLHRLILLSAVYQQSSEDSPKGYALDPDNRLLWRMNRTRLDFEALRDSLLSASGELDLQAGGRSSDLFASPASKRRTVYGFIDRRYLPGVFRVFDFANPDMHTPQRSDTTVPQQALYFLNSPFVVERARALAQQPEVVSASQPQARIERLYQRLFQRPPTSAQLQAGLRFIRNATASTPPEPPAPKPTAWSYGWGEYDEAMRRTKSFNLLPHFTGDAWQGGEKWPDPKLGWAQLTAEGGHTGNDLQHAVIRRWTSPVDGTVRITGLVSHEPTAGDGVRAFLVSGRHGMQKEWTLHAASAEHDIALNVKAGDYVDFVVDFRATLNSDEFKWAPHITLMDAVSAGSGSAAAREWDARKEFGGPPPAPVKPLSPWEKYAQVLLLANEFVFVD
ncbi:MAG: PSD1 and planctomycete cytochrome C domain-containing protein [Verrucomicrobiota bacterium]